MMKKIILTGMMAVACLLWQKAHAQTNHVPVAGATEIFNVATGDHFFDPGGPGGTSSSGGTGNYSNCDCDTFTTLTGATQIEFLYFSVFADWDHLKIYDGTDNTGTLLYDNGTSGSQNYDDQDLADMIASNGSAIFTGTSGSFYFEFHASGTVDYGGWDVEILSSCPSPTNLIVTNVGSTSADIGWTIGGTENEWKIEYGFTGFALGTGTVVTDNDGTPGETLAGLTFLKEYDVYVASICGPGDESPMEGPLSFKTLAECNVSGSVMVYPFTESFELNSQTLGCWTQIKEAGNEEWVFDTGASSGVITNAYDGTRNARFVSMPGPNTPIIKLVSPIFDLSSLSNPELSFFYAQEAFQGDQNELKVYYRTSASDAWVEIQHYTGDVDTWTQAVFALPNPSATYQIAFEGINNFGHSNVIDDVMVDEALSVSSKYFQSFEFYPNPANNRLSLKSPKEIQQVIIYDLLGQKVLNIHPDSMTPTLELDNLQSGAYLMKVTINGSVGTFRIIKE